MPFDIISGLGGSGLALIAKELGVSSFTVEFNELIAKAFCGWTEITLFICQNFIINFHVADEVRNFVVAELKILNLLLELIWLSTIGVHSNLLVC
jgi:hypothetical protein